VILDPASGLPLEVGRAHRIVPPWIARPYTPETARVGGPAGQDVGYRYGTGRSSTASPPPEGDRWVKVHLRALPY
jgi:hypothetical protein